MTIPPLRLRAALLGTLALPAILPWAQAAHAEEAEPATTAVPDILVTAQKRTSTVQKTPISVAVISGEDLLKRGLTDLSQVASVTPGVSMKVNGPGQTEFEMRGMTSSGGNSPTTGFYLDDVPLTAPAAAQNGKVVIDPTLYDIARVEVLRGPQGTLYGSGSMGGTIKLITNQPDSHGYHASAQTILSGTQGGGFNHTVNGMINIPLISDVLALRIVGSESHTSGWIDRKVESDFPVSGLTRGDVQNGTVTATYKGSNAEQTYALRAAIQYTPNAHLTITPSIFYQNLHQDGPSAFDSTPGTPTHYQPFDIAEPLNDAIIVGNLNVNYKFDTFDVTSVSSFWQRKPRQIQDGSENLQNPYSGFNSITAPSPLYGVNGTGPIFGIEYNPTKQFSQELRLASRGETRIKWVAGVFYSRFRSSYNPLLDLPNPAAFGSDNSTLWRVYEPATITQTAVFGEATYPITPALKLTGGLRWFTYSNDTSYWGIGWGQPNDTLPASQNVHQAQSGLNPKVNLAYEIDANNLVYASAAKGFRPGGANMALPNNFGFQQALTALGYPNGAPPSYNSDSVWSYEIGDKARLFHNHLVINTSAYYENWSNIQLEVLPQDYPLFVNANSAHILGGEIEARAVLAKGLTLAATGGYTHAVVAATLHGYNKGDRLPNVPEFTGNISLNYSRPLSETLNFTAHIETTFTSSRVDLTFPGGNPDTQTPLPGYSLTNLRLTVAADQGWTAAVFVNNLTDKKAWLENIVQLTLANASYNRVATNQPRTAGIDLSYRF